jgi:hypothetical protein
MIKRVARLALIGVGIMIGACSGTSVTGSWKNPDYTGQVNKVYIVGIAKQDTTRRIFEDQFSRLLASYGVTGIASYRDLPTTAETGKDVIAAKVRENGADSVLLTRAVGKRTEQVVTPGRISSYDYGPSYWGRGGYYPDPYYRSYGSYYARSRDIVYEPATVTQFHIVTIEANLYSAATQELIWSAQLETVVEGNLEKQISDFIETVTKDLKAQGLL